MRDYHIRSGHGFIIVYSVTATSSLAEAEKLAEHVRRVKDSEKVAIVLVGNKCDLVDMRTISTLEGERTARRMRSGFYETSAKKRINVDDMFIQSVRRIKYFGKQARTSGTGSSTSQESKGSAQSDRRDTIKPEVAKPKTNSGSSTKSWMPTRKSTPPPPPLAVVDDTSDIIDSYYAIADDYRIPSPTTKHRNTAAVAQADSKRRNTRAASQMPEQRRNTRMSYHPAKRTMDTVPPIRAEGEKPVIRLVGYGTDIQQLQKSANVNKALPMPKRRKQWQAHACPIL
ncbi:Ras- protein Rap-1A [Coemansia sp. RSA 2052]|nr:Ras- protein Rap-1A [Coemansia sp. RSA 2052]